MNRPRLSAAYAAFMFAGLLIFAAAAVVSIDRTLRSTLDSRLSTEANATGAFIDVKHGAIAIDSDDRKQFLSVLSVASNGVVLDRSGNVLLSSSANAPAAVRALGADSGGYYTVGSGDTALRAFAAPMSADGKRIGTVVIWRSVGWIGETDRESATAFAAAALVIAVLALLAGDRVTRRALDDAFQRQRRFTADASHELRAPLAVIRAESDLALRRERDPSEYRAAIQTIAAETDRMEGLIGDLLSAARAESGRFKRERTDLSAIVTRVSERLRSTLAAKQSAIGVDVPSAAYVLADEKALERAIMAVGHNAVQHVPKGGRVQMELRKDGAWFEVEVQDSGPGFTASALAHAFDRFWREGSAVHEPGTGLGLAIAKSIVESCGGQIRLTNQPDGGARVLMRLPASSG